VKQEAFCLTLVERGDGKVEWALASTKGKLASGKATPPFDRSVVGRMATALKRAVFKFDREARAAAVTPAVPKEAA
jgi:hypothetical protein